MRKSLAIVLFIFIPFSSLFASDYKPDGIPEWLQNRKWLLATFYEDQVYIQDSTNFIIETTCDSITYIGDSHSWKPQQVKEGWDNACLYRDRDNEDDYYKFEWVDEKQGLGKWFISQFENNYEWYDCTDFYVIDSAHAASYPFFVMDTTKIKDVLTYLFYVNPVEETINVLDIDYNKDGVLDRIATWRASAYEDDINHSHRYYYISSFQSNEDGTFRTDGQMYIEVQKPGELRTGVTSDDKYEIKIYNVVDEANYDPFVNLQATLDEFEKVKITTDTYYYDINTKKWILEKSDQEVTTEDLSGILHYGIKY